MEKVKGSITKKDFCKVLQKALVKTLGISISLEKAYEVFKLSTFLPYHIANKKNFKVQLAGVGVFRVHKTNSGNVVPKMYGSDTVKRILTAKGDLMDYVFHPSKYRNPEGTIDPAKEEKEPEAETPKKKAETPKKKAETPKKKAETPKKKAETPKKKEEPVEEVEEEIIEDSEDLDIDVDDLEGFEL